MGAAMRGDVGSSVPAAGEEGPAAGGQTLWHLLPCSLATSLRTTALSLPPRQAQLPGQAWSKTREPQVPSRHPAQTTATWRSKTPLFKNPQLPERCTWLGLGLRLEGCLHTHGGETSEHPLSDFAHFCT